VGRYLNKYILNIEKYKVFKKEHYYISPHPTLSSRRGLDN